MRRRLLIGLFVIAAAASGGAQTITRTLQWTQPADTVANVATYTTTVRIDAGAPAIQTPACTQAGPDVTCSTPIVLTSGPHTIVLTQTNGGGQASGTLNYVPPAPPTGPGSFRVVVTITVP